MKSSNSSEIRTRRTYSCTPSHHTTQGIEPHYHTANKKRREPKKAESAYFQSVGLLIETVVVVVRRFFGHIQNGLETDFTLRFEVDVIERALFVFGQRLVEVVVLLVFDLTATPTHSHRAD
jgi:hypothetical protein